MLKTVSVRMNFRPGPVPRSLPAAAASRCGYTSIRARESRQASMRLAWLSRSATMRVPGPARDVTRPRLAM
jgi:hypothetical protein